MSNLGAVIKVADQIISRIFDQRQFTTGEISYLGRELDEGLNIESNFDKLLKINENVLLTSDLSTEDMCSSHDAKTKDISDKVATLVEKSEKLVQYEDECFARDENRLAALRKELEEKKRACMVECNTQLRKVVESISNELGDLERKFLKFEENLRNK